MSVRDFRARFPTYDAIFCVALILCGIRFTHGMENSFDLGHYNENINLVLARDYFLRGRPLAPDFGPLYQYWVWAWEAALSPLRAFYANAAFLCVALALATYLVARRLAAPVPSLLASLFVLIADVNLPYWSKPYHFGVVVPLAGFAVGMCLRNTWWMLATFSAALAVGMWVRVENSFAFFFSLALFAYELRRTRAWRSAAVPLVFLLAFVGALLWKFGNPLGGGHYFYTFSMMIGWRWQQPHGTKELMDRLFPGAQTGLEAVLINPAVAAKFYWANLLDTPKAILTACFDHRSLTRSITLGRYESPVLCGLILGGALRFRKILSRNRFWPAAFREQALAFLLVVMSVQSLIGGVIVFPQPIYLIPVCVTMWIMVARCATLIGEDLLPVLVGRLPRLTSGIALAAVLLAIVPANVPAPWRSLTCRHFTKRFSELPLRLEPGTLFVDDQYRYGAFLDDRITMVAYPARMNDPILQYLKKHNVGFLVDYVSESPKDAEGFRALRAAPERYGYTRMAKFVPPLYVRTDLLVKGTHARF